MRAVGITLDVTERRTLEEQFHQAQKMEAIGRLAGGVAHDFNNLLTAILGYCELVLADLSPDDPRQADMAEIQKAGTSAAALTRQLLAFSRKQLIEPTQLNLNVVVADMRGMLGRLIGEDVKVLMGLRPELGPVKADRGQVEQIVLNFPRMEAAEMVVDAPRPVARLRAHRAETVLVVEDAAGLRELARRLLQRLGYTVLVAADAHQALRLFEQNASIDVVLTDVVMPGASGPDLTRRLVAERPALKVIYMPGYTEDAIVRNGVLNPGTRCCKTVHL